MTRCAAVVGAADVDSVVVVGAGAGGSAVGAAADGGGGDVAMTYRYDGPTGATVWVFLCRPATV